MPGVQSRWDRRRQDPEGFFSYTATALPMSAAPQPHLQQTPEPRATHSRPHDSFFPGSASLTGVSMNADNTKDSREQERRMHAEMLDSIDEELEMEIDDDRMDALVAEATERAGEGRDLSRNFYFKELFRLQGELVKLQDWVVHKGLKVVVLFEGRDAAGKGGVIKRITQRLNPRVCHVVALPAPSSRERTQWYFQRYVPHLPAAGEIVLFDRSWYNRAGVEKVMGFCDDDDCEDFFRTVPEFEKMLIRSGIILIKYWFSITDDEQHMRFLMRIRDPLKQWKLSPMDMDPGAAGSSTPRPRKSCSSVLTFRSSMWIVEAVDKKKPA